MNLFLNEINTETNLLPFDGEVYYYPDFLNQTHANIYFEKLKKNIQWKNDLVKVFGKEYIMDRQTAWYGDQLFSYTYSNKTKIALPWQNELMELLPLVNEQSKTVFNCCLANLYPDGNSGMGWHADNEKTLVKNAPIASLSLGADRFFKLKHKTSGKIIALTLQHGSLLVMKNETQDYWIHCLPKAKKINTSRINLTFRVFNTQL